MSQRYCRKCKQWFNHECLEDLECRSNHIPVLPGTASDLDLEKDFLIMLTMPICRGGRFGVVGNGSVYSCAKSLFKEAKVHGALPRGWRSMFIGHDPRDYEGIHYYRCPSCIHVLC